jgi:hypothetical protein
MRDSGAIDEATLRRCWIENDDGAGYMFAYKGKLCICKPFFKFKHLLRSYLADYAMFGKHSAFVMHFRWATHGSRNEQNTHPHTVIPGKVALVHNGILPVNIPQGQDISDTVYFIHSHLRKLQPQQLMGRRFCNKIGKAITGSNKLVLLDNAGEVSIVNEEFGVWDGSIWYSNMDYKERAKYNWKGIAHLYRGQEENPIPQWEREMLEYDNQFAVRIA